MGDTRRTVTAIVAVGAIVFAAILLANYFNKQRRVRSKEYTVSVMCEACGKTADLPMKGRPNYPLKCPHCGAMAAYKRYKCRGCGYTWPVKPGGGPIMSCPTCGSPRVGGDLPAAKTDTSGS